jgi:hypothetical protein
MLCASEAIKSSELHPTNFKAMTTFNIVDASGDSSKTEVFEDGALKISFNSNNWPQEYQANAHVSAKDLETGDVVDLGTKLCNIIRDLSWSISKIN